MKKIILLPLVLIVVSMFSLACDISYGPSDNVLIYDVIEELGDGAECNITIYKNNTLIDTSLMTRFGLSYSYDAGVLNESLYIANIECNLSNSSFLGQCKFTVEVKGDDMYSGLAIMVFTNLAMFLVIFWLLNNLRVNMGQEKVKHIKTDLVVKFIFIFLAFLLNLAVVGFTWYTSNAISEQLARMAFVFFILNIIGILAFAFYIGFKMFTLPVEAIKGMLIKATGDKKSVWESNK